MIGRGIQLEKGILNVLLDRMFLFFLHGSLFLFCFEMAAGSSFYVLEYGLAGLGVCFLAVFWRDHRRHPAGFLRLLWGRTKGCGALLVLLAAYILMDGVNWLAGDQALGLSKYKVTVAMLFLSACLLYACRGKKRVDGVLLTLGSAAGFTAVFACLNYLYFKIYPIYYTLLLSLRVDYNMFATTLFFGGVCGVFWWFRQGRRESWRCLALAVYLAVVGAAILLSGSRRIFLLLLPGLAALGFLWLAYAGPFKKKARLSLAGLLAAVILLSAGIQAGMESYMNGTYQVYGSYGPGGVIGLEDTGATTAIQRYETIGEPSLFEKRRILWGIALRDAHEYSPAELLTGKGGGYDISLYDRVNSRELARSYTREIEKGTLSAHNFVLADLLNGGIPKAVMGLLLWGWIGILAFRLIRKAPGPGVVCGGLCGLVLLNNLISNRYGFLYDKFFYLAVLLLIWMIREGGVGRSEKKGLHGDLSAPAQ